MTRYRRIDAHVYIETDVKYPVNLIVSEGQIIGFHQPALPSSLTGAAEGYGFRPPETVMISMRDGCALATDIYLPE